MRKPFFWSKLRSTKSGTTMIVILLGANMVLLPLGLFSFEVSRLNMATKQLKVATDSAALAAASYLANSSGNSEANMAAAKDLAFKFFKKNMVMSQMLDQSVISQTVDTDSPNTNHGTFDLVLNSTNGRVTAKAAFGLEPAFGHFIGIGTAPIHTHSLAGYEGLIGDVVMAVDISDSMTYNSKSVIAKRTYNASSNTVTYENLHDSKAVPALGHLGSASAVPPPETAKYDKSPLFKNLKNESNEVKLAALVEAKRGNLENQAIFDSSHTSSGILNGKVTPQDGWKAGYQQVALEQVAPLADEKIALTEFINSLGNGDDAHLALVTFGGKNSDGPDAKDSFTTYSGHGYPMVNLSKTENKKQLVVESLAPALTKNGTDTKGAIEKATEILESGDHRPEVPKTIVLLTDGVPTTGSPKNAAKIAGEKGIKIYAIGFFQSPYSQTKGPATLNAIVAAAGNGSKMYLAPDLPTLQDVLKQISHGTLALINED